jgi:cytochrome c biogenesis protein CcdA
MIGAFFEGITQSLLPCSWILLLPAVAVGFTRPRPSVVGSLFFSTFLFAWLAVSGFLVIPVSVAGLLMVGAAANGWFRSLDIWSAALAGAAVSSAWQPCVGPQLGEVLNQAQLDPFGAAAGLAAFILGVYLVGLLVGWALSRLLRGRYVKRIERTGAVVLGFTGIAMTIGIYQTIASTLAGWSYSLWA